MPINSATLSRYLNGIFVETGTFLGDGTAAALEAGFQKVYTIEIHPDRYRDSCRRFQGDQRVELFEGSSSRRLQEVLAKIDQPATFWLDSHTCGAPFTGGDWETPLIGELRMLALHAIKTHTILIDDLHLCEFELPGMPELLMRLKRINPDYNVYTTQSADPSLGLDILVAEPLKSSES